MKVCLFADFPPSALKGVAGGRGSGQQSTWLLQLASAYEAYDDLELHWCVFEKTRRQEATEKWKGQTFHFLPGGRLTTGLLSGRWLPRLAFRRVLRTVRPDVIHCWGSEHLYSAALWEHSGPSILSMQGMLGAYWQAGGISGWRWRLLRDWEARAVCRATVVTAESQWGLHEVLKLCPHTTPRQVEYGVSPGFYEVQWNPDPGAPRILFAGTLGRLKGFDILLELLARNRDLPWTLVVAGKGELMERLQALQHPSVEIKGVLTTPQLQEELARAWALVLPSRADTSPNVVKEARVAGLPVVVSPNGGQAEYVEHGVDGLRVDSEDPDAWRLALARLCGNFAECTAMGSIHQAGYRAHFRPENTASSFASLYRELSGSPGV